MKIVKTVFSGGLLILALQGEPERLEKVWELRRCLHQAGGALNALLES